MNLDSAELILRSGDALVTLLKDGKRFAGIGRVKAQDLWNAFGEELFDIIESGDVERLKMVLSEKVAFTLCSEFKKLSYVRALQSLMTKPIPSDVCIGLLKAYGPESVDRVKEDPYRLLCFIQKWERVDAIARTEFQVERYDSRRLRAAVNEALISRFNHGNTAAHLGQIKSSVEAINRDPVFIEKALDIGGGKLFRKSEKLIHPIGPWLMETVIADKIAIRLNRRSYQLNSIEGIEDAIGQYEGQNGIELTIEQRDAILMSVREPFSLILGGPVVARQRFLKVSA